jgi:hypothetical protein
MRSACSDQQLASRRQRCVTIKNLAGQSIAIDGYNVLITVEAAMSGGVIFKGRDGATAVSGIWQVYTERTVKLPKRYRLCSL